MTNCTSHSDKGLSDRGHSEERLPDNTASDGRYQSLVWFDADSRGGVRYAIARMSFSRRVELARRIREIGRKMEFLEATSDIREKLEATVLAVEIDRTYLDWGLIGIEGLFIDETEATPAMLIEKGPVDLALEILGRIKAECSLTEPERKN